MENIEVEAFPRSDGGIDYDFPFDGDMWRIFWDGGETCTFSLQPATEGDLVEIDIPNVTAKTEELAQAWVLHYVSQGFFVRDAARAALLNSQGQ